MGHNPNLPVGLRLRKRIVHGPHRVYLGGRRNARDRAHGRDVRGAITVTSTITLTAIGAILTSGGSLGTYALYTDLPGAPGTLLAQTASALLGTGTNEIPVTPSVTLQAGTTYWIAAEYSADTSLVSLGDAANAWSNQSSEQPYGPFTNGLAWGSDASEGNYPYYVVGTE